jgi:hypothetical protein
MRIWVPALLLLGVAMAVWFFLREHPSAPGAGASPENHALESATVTSPPPAAPVAKPNSSGQPAYASAVTVTPSVNPPEIANATAGASVSVAPGIPHQLEFTDLPPETVLGKVAHAIRDYASMFGGNPVGTNPEITAALNGQNPRHANFINPEAGMRINGNGELVDAWGTPYFFHQLSGTEMEIHSAGPDHIMWTADDLITK